MARAPRSKTPAGVYRIAPGSRAGAASAGPGRPERTGQSAQPRQSLPGRPAALPPSAASSGTLRRRRGLSLRTRLILALVSVAALPMLATAGGGILLARNSLITQGQLSLLSRANATVNKIEGYIAQSSNALLSVRQVVAAVEPALADPDPTVHQTTLASLEQILADERQGRNGLGGGQVTSFVDPAGMVVAADPTGDEGLDLHANPVVVAALAGHETIAPVVFDPGQASDLRETFVIAAPVYPANTTAQGHPIGALYERFSLEQIAAWVQQDSDGAGGGGILVEPNTGVMLAESLPPARYTFATLAPLPPAAAQQLVTSGRYIPVKAGQTPPVEPIPGLGLNQVGSGATFITAGTFGGSDASALLYARIGLTQLPLATPWVYLLGIPQSTLTAPADSLGVLAGIILLVALVVGVLASLVAARVTRQWLTGGMRQLGAVATAFLRHSDEQRETAEEQRRRLAGARSALHDLHALGAEITEAIEQGLISLEDGARGQSFGTPGRSALANGHTAAGAHTGAGDASEGDGHSQATWWTQWAQTLQGRLSRQRDICARLGTEAHLSASAANGLRERGAAVYAQAASIDAALRSGDVRRVAVARGQPAAALEGQPPAALGTRGTTGFGTGWLRAVLLALLLMLGLVPSIAFATASARGLRRNLTNQSTQTLELQAQSDASAVDAVLSQQNQELTGLTGLYLSQANPTSGVTANEVSQELDALVLGEAQTTGITTLELVDASDGQVVAASSNALIGDSVRGQSLFKTVVSKGIVSTGPVAYDPIIKQGYYSIGVPIRNTQVVGPGKQVVIGVAIGKFSVANAAAAISGVNMHATAATTAFVAIIERADSIIIADSRQSGGVYASAVSLNNAALNAQWDSGRYPIGQSVPVVTMTELAQQAQKLAGNAAPLAFTGSGGSIGASQFGLAPSAVAPWAIAVARPLATATAVSDQLTRLDVILFIVVAAATAALALLLGQSIITPVRRLRARFRTVARQLVAVTRRQDEAAQRQEAALPPIETTAELLGLETDEVSATLFPTRASPAPQALRTSVREIASAPSPRNLRPGAGPVSVPPNVRGPGEAMPFGVVEAGRGAYGSQLPVPVNGRSMTKGATGGRASDALRQARNIANDWSLRQQRIMADLAAAHNATDELSRACLEGQREAVELGNLVAELLASAR